MSLVIDLPLTDFSLRPVTAPGERLVDANARVAERLGDPETAVALGRKLGSGPDDQLGLLATAAGTLLRAHRADITWLRAMGAMLRAASADDQGLRASLDDIELRAGTTEHSADVVDAAARCALFEPELRAAADAARAAGGAEVVVDTDQQLPAAFRLVALAGPDRCVLSGRFVTRHREALGRVPHLAATTLVPRVRPRVLRAEWCPGSLPVRPLWVDRLADWPAGEPWLGWLDAADVAALTPERLRDCLGLVVTVARLPSLATAAGVAGVPVDLGRALAVLPGDVPVAVELLVGAPGVGRPELDRAVEVIDAAKVRLAGLRPFRLPTEPPSGPRAVEHGRDLPRWAAGERVDGAAAALLAESLERARSRTDLLPGRIAGALLVDEVWEPIAEGYTWDPAATVVRTGHAEDYLVNLRTGQLARVTDGFAGLLAGLRGGGAERRLHRLPEERRARLWASLVSAGAVRAQGVRS